MSLYLYRSRPERGKPCSECPKTFIPVVPNKKACSPTCQRKRDERIRLIRKAKKTKIVQS